MLACSTEICEVGEVQINEPLWSAFFELGMVVRMGVRARIESKEGAKGIMQSIPREILDVYISLSEEHSLSAFEHSPGD